MSDQENAFGELIHEYLAECVPLAEEAAERVPDVVAQDVHGILPAGRTNLFAKCGYVADLDGCLTTGILGRMTITHQFPSPALDEGTDLIVHIRISACG